MGAGEGAGSLAWCSALLWGTKSTVPSVCLLWVPEGPPCHPVSPLWPRSWAPSSDSSRRCLGFVVTVPLPGVPGHRGPLHRDPPLMAVTGRGPGPPSPPWEQSRQQGGARKPNGITVGTRTEEGKV